MARNTRQTIRTERVDLPKVYREVVTPVLQQIWPVEKLIRLGIPGLQNVQEEHVMLLLNSPQHHRVHCKDLRQPSSTPSMRHFKSLEQAHKYIACMLSGPVTVVLMDFFIRGKKLNFTLVRNVKQVLSRRQTASTSAMRPPTTGPAPGNAPPRTAPPPARASPVPARTPPAVPQVPSEQQLRQKVHELESQLETRRLQAQLSLSEALREQQARQHAEERERQQQLDMERIRGTNVLQAALALSSQGPQSGDHQAASFLSMFQNHASQNRHIDAPNTTPNGSSDLA